MYGSLEAPESRRRSKLAGVHWAIPVSAVALLALLAIIVVHNNSNNDVVELASDEDSAVLRNEKQGIAAAQATLDSLNRKAEAESALLHKSALNAKKQAILASASKTKARASRKVAAALLATVKQHTEEIAKRNALAEHSKEEGIFRKEHALASKLEKQAAAAKAREEKAAAEAAALSSKALKDKAMLKQIEKEVDSDRTKIEHEKLIAENNKADAASTQHLADLGFTSAAARKQSLHHLKNKLRRLDRKIAQIKRKYSEEKSDEAEDTKAAQQYRTETDAARADKQRLHEEMHSLKIKQDDQSRQSDLLDRKLEAAKELVHDRDNVLQRALSREHEAATALRRAKDRLKDAERRIYHAQMKNEADRNPSDADLGLV